MQMHGNAIYFTPDELAIVEAWLRTNAIPWQHYRYDLRNPDAGWQPVEPPGKNPDQTQIPTGPRPTHP